MSPRFDRATARRRFIQFLAASPLFARAAAPGLAQSISTPARLPDPMVWAPREPDNLISDPKDALDVFDFEPVARKSVPLAHFGYMVTGIDDEVTPRANREGFLKFQLRPRRLVDDSVIDMTVEIFGAKYDSPIVIAPTGSNRAFHPDGELAVANAARVGNHLQISLQWSNDVDRRCDRSTRRAHLVSGLCAEVGGHPSACPARGTSWIPRGGHYRRWRCADELGDVSPAPAYRYAAMRWLSW